MTGPHPLDLDAIDVPHHALCASTNHVACKNHPECCNCQRRDVAALTAEVRELRERIANAGRVIDAARVSKYRRDADWLWLNFRAALMQPTAESDRGDAP